MTTAREDTDRRSWIFFYLILLVALLWASFLLVRGEMITLSVALAVIAGLISVFSFVHCRAHRMWVFFFLIVLVALLWASFLFIRGSMVWVSLFLVLVAIGMSIFSFVMCAGDERKSAGAGS